MMDPNPPAPRPTVSIDRMFDAADALLDAMAAEYYTDPGNFTADELTEAMFFLVRAGLVEPRSVS